MATFMIYHHNMRVTIFGICLLMITSLPGNAVSSERVLNLPRAVENACAIVRGRPTYWMSTSFYDSEEKHEFERDQIWTLDITDIYLWDVPRPRGRALSDLRKGVPKRIVFVERGYVYVGKRKDTDVVVFLTCNYHADYYENYIFTVVGWPILVYDHEKDGVGGEKFIDGDGLTIRGFGKGEIPLDDFVKAVKKEGKKRGKKGRKSKKLLYHDAAFSR